MQYRLAVWLAMALRLFGGPSGASAADHSLRVSRAFALSFLALVLASACPVRAAPAKSPSATISAIYRLYRGQDEPKLPDNIYSPRLRRLFEANDKKTPKGEIGALDFDVFVNGQDWKLAKVIVKQMSRAPGHARVVAKFRNLGRPTAIAFDLVADKDHWLIDDVRSLDKPRWTLSKILQETPDAFPDQK